MVPFLISKQILIALFGQVADSLQPPEGTDAVADDPPPVLAGQIERVLPGQPPARLTGQRSHHVTVSHGDLLAENLLVSDDGRLAGVLDFGGLAIGDPSVDLVAAWEVLDAEGRQVLREVINVSDAEWRKGMGWALFIALITFPYYWNTMPKRCADRLAMAQAVLSEA